MKLAELIAEGWHEVTHLDLPTLVRRAYDLSRPRGLGLLHFMPGTMGRADAERLIEQSATDRFAVRLDYVQGRCLKFDVWRAEDDLTRLFVEPSWYDHTPEQLAALLAPTTQEV